jgi:NAD(P)-dependent dehydrogenase (short-subunit alcohol dehydrogenase family)
MLDAGAVPVRNPQGTLSGKVALVIGAGSAAAGWGNGNAACALFAREGASVFCVDRNPDSAQETAELVGQIGQSSGHAQADATSGTDVKRVVQACIDRFGRIDILHNNVGGGVPGRVMDMAEPEWDRVMRANLSVAYLSCHEVLPHMVRQRSGAIVNVSSIAAIAYMQNSMSAYAAAKMAMIAMTRNIALDHLRDNVRANCIVVGTVDTAEIRRRAAEKYGAERVEEVMAIRAEVMPRVGRAATPWDVANAALYLASDESGYVTGTELIVAAGDQMSLVPNYLAQVPAT